MKLISMHVDNFGGLHDYDFSFEDGLNVVLHDNGWGKTTMAAFLKAMLYGFDSKRSKDITENERRRYFPWQGGAYGGSLDFEADGNHYRIYRTFGETPRFDKVKIVNLNNRNAAKIDPEKIGETLFRLDANAFQRSVFINQNGLAVTGAASSIHTRLNTLVSQANDVAAYDDAIANLTAQIKVYEKTGARGKLGDIVREISALERQRDQLNAEIAAQDEARDRISQIDILLSSLNEELEKKKAQLEAVSGEAKKREASQKLLNDVNNQLAQLQGQVQQLRTDLGGKIPTQKEIDEIKRQKQILATASAQLKEMEVGYTDLVRKLDGLLAPYHGSVPGVAQLDEIQQIYGELQGILSAETEELADGNSVPKGFALIQAAEEADQDYISKLKIMVGSQMTLQQYIRKLESLRRDVGAEEESWEEKRRKYSALVKEQAQLQADLDALAVYEPKKLEPVIHGLKDLQKKQSSLVSQKTEVEDQLGKETENWEAQKQRYAQLCAEEDLLKAEVERNARYAEECLLPAIEKLEKIRKDQQLVAVKQESLQTLLLTQEQEAWLAEQPASAPDVDEAISIRKKYRAAAAHEAQLQGIAARREGEQSKINSLQASMSHLDLLLASEVASVQEPPKPMGGILIGAGAAVAAAGLLAAVLVTPVLAVLALVGALLIVAGVMQNRRYQAERKNYEVFREAEHKRKEAEDERAELRKKMDAIAHMIAEYDREAESIQRQIEADQAEVAAWMARWAPSGTQASESSITQILEDAEKATKLRGKQQESLRLKQFVDIQSREIAQIRAEVDGIYPELKETCTEEALRMLRGAQTDFRIKQEKLDAAVRNTARFLHETGTTQKQLTQDDSPKVAPLRLRLEQIEAELTQIPEIRRSLDEQLPSIAGKTHEETMSFLLNQQSAYQVSESRLQTARNHISSFVKEAKVTESQLAMETSPYMDQLRSDCATAETVLREALEDANSVLDPLDLMMTADNMPLVLRKAEQMLHEHQQYLSARKGRAERQEKKQRQILDLQRKLEAKLSVLQGCYEEETIPERVARVRNDVAEIAGLRGKLAENELSQRSQKSQCEQAENAVAAFVKTYGQFTPKTQDTLSEIFEMANLYDQQQAAMQPLVKQRAAIEKEQTSVQHQPDAGEAALRFQITGMEDRRDRLLVEYTQKSDFIRRADAALEKLPELLIEIRHLYEQKQKAQSTLAMLKRTIQLITKAKENLANRYLSKVEQLFNSYMHAWLSNDAVRGILDVDFNITIEEKDQVHVAEGYSTGYCDLIDFCMRLALVDTLFEGEQPFLILDDPFVNLDEDHLQKALELLNVMAASKQVIYFVCHPIRAIDAQKDSSSRAEFARLAEQTRKTLEGRKNAAATPKKILRKSPKELYTVVPGAVLGFQLAKPGYVITNNIFSLQFVPTDAGSLKEKSYELFFIDQKGRVLNDRQLLEVKAGKLSAQKVQFCLNSRDDSGDQYELMIQESGQEDYAVVARFPFKAKLAFVGADHFEF